MDSFGDPRQREAYAFFPPCALDWRGRDKTAQEMMRNVCEKGRRPSAYLCDWYQGQKGGLVQRRGKALLAYDLDLHGALIFAKRNDLNDFIHNEVLIRLDPNSEAPRMKGLTIWRNLSYSQPGRDDQIDEEIAGDRDWFAFRLPDGGRIAFWMPPIQHHPQGEGHEFAFS